MTAVAPRTEQRRLRSDEKGFTALLSHLAAEVLEKVKALLALLLGKVRSRQAAGERVDGVWLGTLPEWGHLAAVLEAETHATTAVVTAAIDDLTSRAQKRAEKAWKGTASLDLPPVQHVVAKWAQEVVHGVKDDLVSAASPHSALPLDQARAEGIVADALGGFTGRSTVIGRTRQMEAYRSTAAALAPHAGMTSWTWVSEDDTHTCPSCLAMDGTVHPYSEELLSHPGCRCIQDWHADPPLTNVPRWATLTDAELYAVLGPGKFAAFQDGSLTLDDDPRTGVVGRVASGEWAGSIYERPLKDFVSDVSTYTQVGLLSKPNA